MNVSEEMVGKSWLCQDQDNYQVKECNTDECRVYGAWNEWTKCSKFCGGYRTRSRECVSNSGNPCNPNFLKETEPCSFVDDCVNTILGKLEPVFLLFRVHVYSLFSQFESARVESNWRRGDQLRHIEVAQHKRKHPNAFVD